MTPNTWAKKPYINQILGILAAIEEADVFASMTTVDSTRDFITNWSFHVIVETVFLKDTEISDSPGSANRSNSSVSMQCLVEYDLIVGTFDSTTLKQSFSAIKLGAYHFGIAVRSDNPLAQLDEITFSDLVNQKILMVPRGISEKNDLLRKQLLAATPSIKAIDTEGRYDINTFNKAVEENIALISLTPWKRIHPNLVTIPLKTDITVPYGLLSTKFPGNRTAAFLREFRRLNGLK